jgi:4,5-DOPA dioxygenase extradiol
MINPSQSPTHLPALFVSHGAPTVALQHPEEDAYARALTDFGQSLGEYFRGIVVVSAHWLSAGPVQITSSARPGIVHDFHGFQPELYEMRYDAPGDPALAQEIQTLLQVQGIESKPNPERKLDHGAWVPLHFIRPQADIPVIQISIPMTQEPRQILKLGNALAPLRRKGILLIGSGGAVHNLRELQWHGRSGGADTRAVAFDTWLKRALTEGRIEDLLDFEHGAPDAAFAHPTHEHFVPLFFTIGSSIAGDHPRFVYEGFQYGTLSMLTFALA